MKIQIALDRISLGKAIESCVLLRDYTDIIEIGTSLIKDYGNLAIREIKNIAKDALVLADMKVIDEGAYEFEAAFDNGADLVTLMAAASMSTVELCEKSAQAYGKDYVIDLLGVSGEKEAQIIELSSAILCYHMPSDEKGGLDELIDRFKQKEGKLRGAIAGGVSEANIASIKKAGFEIAVVGSAITKADDMLAAAKRFKELAK